MDEKPKDTEENETMLQMIVGGITLDPVHNMPIVILKEPEGDKAIPIWIGLVEASAIATELEGVKLARPMTHDLLKNVLQTLNGKLIRIEIHDLKENTFYAALIVQGPDGGTLTVDSRPSDAIALALRTGSPVYVSKRVIELSQHLDLSKPIGKEGNPPTSHVMDGDMKQSDKDKWTQILENLKPEDFGKYKM
jgi:uncharacterized protein